MASSVWRLRAGALVLAGALVVHELRYALAGVVADEHAHSYLSWLGPLVCGVLILAAAEFAFRLRRLARSRELMPVPGVGACCLGFGGLLFVIFALQEGAEMLVVHGRVDLAESLVVHGGWIAGPLSLVVGGLIALLLRGARVLLARVASGRPRPWPRAQRAPRPRLDHSQPRLNVLARNLAGRAPPSPFVV
ncbi:MAG TPA: hypothetical protein VNT32_11950 [Thermoleophilaceae bacterium]|nr:hypothetical protein [Thermoleophilaceae bacterium]